MQERATGLITGIEEFIAANNAPVALDMPCETYEPNMKVEYPEY